MTKPAIDTRTRTAIIIAILLPIFMGVSLWWVNNVHEAARLSDFAQYWQGGRMILDGSDVYNSDEWLATRAIYGTRLGSEPTYQYPLPFAIILAPLSLLTVTQAFILWMFFEQVAILTSILLLFTFYPRRSALWELLALVAVFLFRPTFIVIFGGQIAAGILFFITLAAYLFNREQWFYGGLVASLAILKPSLGAPFLILLGTWLLSKKQWSALAGIILGALLLYGIGALYNFHWALDYLNVGSYNFNKYYAMQVTLWSVAGLLFYNSGPWKLIIGLLAISMVLLLTVYFLRNKNIAETPFLVIAVLTATTLLVAPYSWNYEQILLAVPIIYILAAVAAAYGDWLAALCSLFIVGLAVVLVLIAYRLEHDVWSVLISVVVWVIVLFLSRFHPVVNA